VAVWAGRGTGGADGGAGGAGVLHPQIRLLDRIGFVDDGDDALADQGDGDGREEDHDDLVHDGHGVFADEADENFGIPHGGEEDCKVEDEGGGDEGHDEDLALGAAVDFVVGFGVGIHEEQRGGHGGGADDEGDGEGDDTGGAVEGGVVVDGRFAADEEVGDGEDDQEDAAGDLEVGKLDAKETEDGLAEDDEEQAGDAGDDGGAAGDAAAVGLGIVGGDGEVDGQGAGGVHDDEHRDEDGEEVVEKLHEGSAWDGNRSPDDTTR